MIKSIRISILFAALLALPVFAGTQDNRKVEGTSAEIQWGQHWAGPNIKDSSELKGKVVLLVIWGR